MAHFSSQDFLEDAKHEIKRQFGKQLAFAPLMHVSLNTLNRLLNSGDDISVYQLRSLASLLHMEDRIPF
jgi:hypothetical protein